MRSKVGFVDTKLGCLSHISAHKKDEENRAERNAICACAARKTYHVELRMKRVSCVPTSDMYDCAMDEIAV